MNLKDFKEWLSQFPDDTIIEVSVERGGYRSFSTFEVFDPDDYSKYLDMGDFPDIKSDSEFYNKRFLQLGYN